MAVPPARPGRGEVRGRPEPEGPRREGGGASGRDRRHPAGQSGTAGTAGQGGTGGLAGTGGATGTGGAAEHLGRIGGRRWGGSERWGNAGASGRRRGETGGCRGGNGGGSAGAGGDADADASLDGDTDASVDASWVEGFRRRVHRRRRERDDGVWVRRRSGREIRRHRRLRRQHLQRRAKWRISSSHVTPTSSVPTGDNNTLRVGLHDRREYRPVLQPVHWQLRGAYPPGSATDRFWPSLGNHDWVSGNVNGHANYFTLPGNERYYDVSLGLVHLYAIDSDSQEPDGMGSTSTQATWLQESSPLRRPASTSVFFHHPAYSSGSTVRLLPCGGRSKLGRRRRCSPGTITCTKGSRSEIFRISPSELVARAFTRFRYDSALVGNAIQRRSRCSLRHRRQHRDEVRARRMRPPVPWWTRTPI